MPNPGCEDKKSGGLPRISGILTRCDIPSKRFRVLYDCPLCGQDHTVNIRGIPPIEIEPPCGLGSLLLFSASERARET